MNLAAKATILTVGDTKTEPFVERDNLRPGRCRFHDNALKSQRFSLLAEPFQYLPANSSSPKLR